MSNLEQAQTQDENIPSISEKTQEDCSTQLDVFYMSPNIIDLFLQQYLETEEGYN